MSHFHSNRLAALSGLRMMPLMVVIMPALAQAQTMSTTLTFKTPAPEAERSRTVNNQPRGTPRNTEPDASAVGAIPTVSNAPTAGSTGQAGIYSPTHSPSYSQSAGGDALAGLTPAGLKRVAVRMEPGAGGADSIESMIRAALERNPSLAAQQQALQVGVAQFREASAAGAPNVALAARVSIAEGGRTFEIPTGDALNPVYRNLEELNRRNAIMAPPYPTLQNQTLSLLRPREQDTRVVLTMPLYAPTLEPRVRAAGASAVATSAKMEADARHLVRDVKVLWYSLQQALSQKRVFEASTQLLAENLRVHEVLLAEGKITRDAVLRARSEWLAARQAVSEAQFQADQAARRLNVLTARPLDVEVRVPLELSLPAGAAGADSFDPARVLDGFQLPPELRQIAAGLTARKSLEEAAKKNYRPTVGVAVEAGYQGVDYTTGPGTGVAIASVVLNWKFSDGGARDAQLSAAAAARRQLELQQEDAKAQLEGVLRGSGERLRLNMDQLVSAQARQAAAEEAFRIASFKRDAGNLSQLEFFDAQRVLTDARSAAVSAQAQLNIAAAEFELAKSSYPLPPKWLQITEDTLKK